MLFIDSWTSWFIFLVKELTFQGTYFLEMDILVPYATNRKTGFYMDLPKVKLNKF